MCSVLPRVRISGRHKRLCPHGAAEAAALYQGNRTPESCQGSKHIRSEFVTYHLLCQEHGGGR
jgi:hypothetical protein